MIRFKVQCAGIVGHENRADRDPPPQENHPEWKKETIGTFLFHTRTQADVCTSSLRRLGLDPKLVRL